MRDVIRRLNRLQQGRGSADDMEDDIAARAKVREAVEDLAARIKAGEPLPDPADVDPEDPAEWGPAKRELWDRLERMAEANKTDADDDGGSP